MNKTSRTLLSIISLGILLLTLSGGVSASASELDSLGTSQGNRNEASSLTAEVNAAEQNNDGTVAAVTWSIENNGEDPVTLSWLFEGSYTYTGSFFSGVTASAKDSGTRYHPFMDGVGECVCSGNIGSDFLNVLHAQTKLTYWSLYAIPEETEMITIEIPGFEPIEDIPIS